MTTTFQDLQNPDNPLNGAAIEHYDELNLTSSPPSGAEPFMFELVGDNGFTLTIGDGPHCGCAQYAPSDGLPPYLMARDTSSPRSGHAPMSFLVGDTVTPIAGRYRLPPNLVRAVIADFLGNGGRSPDVEWEEYDSRA